MDSPEEIQDVASDDIEVYGTHITSVATSVLAQDFMFQIGYSPEHEKFIFAVSNPRIDDEENNTITVSIPAKPSSVLGARYICIKVAAQLYQIEYDEVEKSKLTIVKPKLIVPGQ